MHRDTEQQKQESGRVHRPGTCRQIPALFGTITSSIWRYRDTQPDMTGFVVKLWRCEPGIQAQSGRGRAEAMLGGSGPCNRNGVPLSDRNGKKLKEGLRRTMMTWLALANAVMMSICSSLCRDVRGHASVPTRSG